MTDEEQPNIRVRLAHEAGHTPTPDELRYWDLLNVTFALGVVILGGRMDLAFSLWLSRGAQELRRNVGAAEAARVFHQFADQMHDMDKVEKAFNQPGGTA